MSQVARAVETASNIIWYYNGPEVGVNDTDNCIIDMMIGYVDDKILESIKFVEKGYGFLRDWMDRGEDHYEIIETIKLLEKSGLIDSRDLSDYEDDDPIYIPDIYIPEWDFSHICGGGENECLLEMELLLEAKNVKTKRLPSAIY
jgi:hypothetical protein